jgi:hypothetical protein
MNIMYIELKLLLSWVYLKVYPGCVHAMQGALCQYPGSRYPFKKRRKKDDFFSWSFFSKTPLNFVDPLPQTKFFRFSWLHLILQRPLNCKWFFSRTVRNLFPLIYSRSHLIWKQAVLSGNKVKNYLYNTRQHMRVFQNTTFFILLRSDY